MFHTQTPLREIGLLELGRDGPVALLEAERARALELLKVGRARFPAALVALADELSRRWLEAAANPYLEEIRAVAAGLPARGAYYLNVNFEWGCTTAVADVAGGPLMLRSLDWPFDGLGRHLIAARFEAAAGPWINLTWPGFVGCIQGFAAGRFAAAINQAPQRPRTGLFLADWLAQRAEVWRRRALPPAHLLRRAFETAADYAAARRILSETPIALPAIFTLAGARPGEGCVIERLEDQAYVRPAPVAASNHWQAPELAAWPRRGTSAPRKALMERKMAAAGHDMAWLEAPILNPDTRLAMAAEPGDGKLSVVGLEADGPVSRLMLPGAAERPASRPAKPLTEDAAAL